MKTDRELLEMAAYAVGGTRHEPSFYGDNSKFTVQGFSGWFNPLYHNDQALLLAIRLEMIVAIHSGHTVVTFHDPDGGLGEISQFGDDKIENTKRAIVDAAASIGEYMQ